MKNLIKVFLIALIIVGCSIEDEIPQKPEMQITSVLPARARIGDIITIKGTNLNLLKNLDFKHREGLYTFGDKVIPNMYFEVWEENEVRVKVPDMSHQKIKLSAGSSEFPLELYGIISLERYVPQGVRQIQVLDEEIAFVHTGRQLIKSTDGYYTWDLVVEYFDNYISSFFFSDEGNAWLAMDDPLRGHGMYISTNGGKNFTHQFPHPDPYSRVRTMRFISPKEGFYVDDRGVAYEYKNGVARDIYDAYPLLKAFPYSKIEFYDLALSNDLVFFSPNFENVLVRLDKGQVSYTEFPERPGIPQIFEEVIYLPTAGRLYKSTDRGETWDIVHHVDDWYPSYLFLSRNEGYAYTDHGGGRSFRTEDGGVTWIAEENQIPSFQLHSMKDFSGSTGLFGNSHNLRKYIAK